MVRFDHGRMGALAATTAAVALCCPASAPAGPPGQVVAVKPDIIVSIRERPGPRRDEVEFAVQLQGEAPDDAAAARLGYRSLRARVDIDCETRRDRVVELEVFPGPNLSGPGDRRKVPGGWVQPSDEAFMADVVRTVCKPRRPAVQAADAPLAPAPLRPAQSLARAAAPRAPAPPRLLAAALLVKPNLPAPAGPRVQVGAFLTSAEAQKALRILPAALPAGHVSAVQTATVGGRAYFRALVTGFRNPSDAQAFCVRLRSVNQDCFVR